MAAAMAAGEDTGTVVAVSPTASGMPPVAVVITGPPPASIFSTSAMQNVSTKAAVGLEGSTNAALPAMSDHFSASSTSSRNEIRCPTGDVVACSRIAPRRGPVPATTR